MEEINGHREASCLKQIFSQIAQKKGWPGKKMAWHKNIRRKHPVLNIVIDLVFE